MKKELVVIGLLGLSGCGLAVTATKSVLEPDKIARLENDCRSAKGLIEIGQRIPVSEVKIVAGFIGGYCDELTSGRIPSTTDANTVAWLESNIQGLRTRIGR